jgi:hypothetical protein
VTPYDAELERTAHLLSDELFEAFARVFDPIEALSESEQRAAVRVMRALRDEHFRRSNCGGLRIREE